jgi:hypothetical protein
MVDFIPAFSLLHRDYGVDFFNPKIFSLQGSFPGVSTNNVYLFVYINTFTAMLIKVRTCAVCHVL